MPDGTPIDLGFTDFVDAPGSPSHPGASDFNRVQDDISFLANPPSARLSRTDIQSFPSALSFVGMYWNVVAWSSDPAMTGGVGGSNYTDRILLPYVGEYEAKVVVRSQFNNTTGISQIQLVRVLTDNTTTLIDQDIEPVPPNITYPNVMRITASFLISAAHVAAGAGVRVEYAQNSGGNSAVYTTVGISAYPSFSVRWVGTGNL